MKKIIFFFSLFLLFFHLDEIFSQDTIFIKVHFLYGSKPAKKYKNTEDKWFGGKLGGHVGIEVYPDKVMNFVPHGGFHWFARRNNRLSCFVVHTENGFWGIFGATPENVKKETVIIPIITKQKIKLDSIYKEYTTQTRYDYAFIGMRCGAAAYDILGQINILKKYSYRKTYMKIFFPKKLRRKLVKQANKNNWRIVKQDGTLKRKWEKD